MIIGAGSQFPRNNTHTILQFKFQNSSNFKVNTANNGSGITITDITEGTTNATTQGTHSGDLAGLGKYATFYGGIYNKGRAFQAAYNSKLAIGTKPFTMFCWHQTNMGTYPIGAYSQIFSNKNYTDSCNGNFKFEIDENNGYEYLATRDGTSNYEYVLWTSMPDSGTAFHHFAICRESTGTNKTFVFYDGVKKVTGTVSKALYDNTEVLDIFRSIDGQFYLRGNISNVTLIIGECLWNRSFTPPTRQA